MAVHPFGRADRPARSNNWQDWANLVLAIWLFISPWVLGFGAGAPPAITADMPVEPRAGAIVAAWNAWVLGALVAVISISAIGRMEFWQERLNLVLAIWIVAAPWVLGFTALPAASWDHWAVGGLVLLVSLSLLTRRAPKGPARSAEPD